MGMLRSIWAASTHVASTIGALICHELRERHEFQRLDHLAFLGRICNDRVRHGRVHLLARCVVYVETLGLVCLTVGGSVVVLTGEVHLGLQRLGRS